MFTINDVRNLGLAKLNGTPISIPAPVASTPVEEAPKPKFLKVKVTKAAVAEPVVEIIEEPVAEEQPVEVPVVVPAAPKKRGFKILAPVVEDAAPIVE